MKGLSIDLGTSGFRAQAIDEDGRVIATSISTRHPLPGANVMDHLHFCLELGYDITHKLILNAVHKIIRALPIDLKEVGRVAICGNPIQLSLFQKMEIRDLAFAGKRGLKKMGITEAVKRPARVIRAIDIGLELLDKAELLVPPAVRHEIGADALAMMYITGLLDKDEVAIVTDYGTNAEMAIKVGGDILTGSAAAGPAMEGQHVSCGMLAQPGAIADIISADGVWEIRVLDSDLIARSSSSIRAKDGVIVLEGDPNYLPKGITGTGVVAAIAEGIEGGLVGPPKISTADGKLHMTERIYLTEQDVTEAGKAIGAIRAGHMTLVEEVGIKLPELEAVYMTGASGTYVDPLKARKVGLIPSSTGRIIQAGNTSLCLATEIVRRPELLDMLQKVADTITAKHIMFAESKVFKNAYVCELAYWVEGMPAHMMSGMLALYGIQEFPKPHPSPELIRIAKRDIIEIGPLGLNVVDNVGTELVLDFPIGCLGKDCRKCINECPEAAARIELVDHNERIVIRSDLCNGTACRRCEAECTNGLLFESVKVTGD
jgi:methylamine methyltransferase corrinoid activation protein